MEKKLYIIKSKGTDSSYNTEQRSLFIAFNQEISIEEVLKFGFKNFVYHKIPDKKTTLLYAPSMTIIHKIIRKKQSTVPVYIEGIQVTPKELKNRYCGDCESRAKCLYDNTENPYWCRVAYDGDFKLLPSYSKRDDTNTRITHMLAGMLDTENPPKPKSELFGFRHAGLCQICGLAGFFASEASASNIDWTKYSEDKDPKAKSVGRKAAITKRLKKEACPVCVHNTTEGCGMTWDKCWKTGYYGRGKHQDFAPGLMTPQELNKVTMDAIQKLGGLNQIMEMMRVCSGSFKMEKGKQYKVAFPELTWDLQWTGKYLCVPKCYSSGRRRGYYGKQTINEMKILTFDATEIKKQKKYEIDNYIKINEEDAIVYTQVLLAIMNEKASTTETLTGHTQFRHSGRGWGGSGRIHQQLAGFDNRKLYFRYSGTLDYINIQSWEDIPIHLGPFEGWGWWNDRSEDDKHYFKCKEVQLDDN